MSGLRQNVLLIVLLGMLAMGIAPAAADAAVLADSVAEFSGTQGQDNWYYGYYDRTADADGSYDLADFSQFSASGPFPGFGFNGSWDYLDTDGATPINVPWTAITSTGGHPNGTNSGGMEHWTVRRWEAEQDGDLQINYDLDVPSDNGWTNTQLFLNGQLAYVRTIPGPQPAIQESVALLNVKAGDILDFVFEPNGSDGSDTTILQVTIDDEITTDRVLFGNVRTNSQLDFSSTGTQGENGWTNGYHNVATDDDGVYQADDFIPFPDNYFTGSGWDWPDGNPPWDFLGSVSAHPNGTNQAEEHWVIRRWESDVDEAVQIDWTVSKENIGGGNGVTGLVFVNGQEVDSATIAFDDNVGVSRSVRADVQSGDFIDIVLSPWGTDGTGADGSDGSLFGASISTGPYGTLTWDGLGDGDWGAIDGGTGNSNWLFDGAPGDQVPDADTPAYAVINANTVTVAEDRKAVSLTVDGGGVRSSEGATLSVRTDAVFASGTTLALGDGATLSAGSRSSVDSLTIAGTSTIDAAGEMPVASLSDGGVAATFVKQGSGTVSLDSVVVQPDTVYRIVEGTLSFGSENLLGGSTAVELAGGTLSVTLAGLQPMTFSDLDPGGAFDQSAALPAGYSTGLPEGITANWNGWVWKNANGPNDHTEVPDDRMAIFVGQSTASVTFSEPLIVPELWMNKTTWGDTGDWTIKGLLDGEEQWSRTITQSSTWLAVQEGAEKFINELAVTEGGQWNHLDDFLFTTELGLGTIDLSDVSVTLSGDSTLDLQTISNATVGPLTMEAGTLTTIGAAAGMSFAGTTIDAAATAVGFNPQVPTNPGLIDGNSASVTISKLGSMDLVLGDENVGLDMATFVVQEGRLIGVGSGNAFGAAALQLAGGEAVLAGKLDATDVSYNNAVVVDASSTLTAGSGGVGGAGRLTVTLGSAGKGLAVNDATLTLQTTDDYTLNVAGPLSGNGALELAEGSVTLAGGGSVDSINVSGGNLGTDSDLAVTTMTLTGGVVNTNSSQVTIGDSLTLGETVFSINAENTFTAAGSDLLVGGDLTLSGGTLSIAPATYVGVATFSDLDPGPPTNTQAGLPTDYSTALPEGITATWTNWAWKNAASPNDHTVEPDDRMTVFGTDSIASVAFSEPLVVPELWMNLTTWGDTGSWTVTGLLDEVEVWTHTVTDPSVWIAVQDGAGIAIDQLEFSEGSLWNHADDFAFAEIGGAVSIDQPNTSLVVTADTTVVAEALGDAVLGNLTLDAGARLTVEGAPGSFADVTAGDGASIEIDALVLRGVLSPGVGPGTLSIDGELELDDDAEYLCELAGGASDLVVTSADIFLAGTLTIKAVDQMGTVGDTSLTIFNVTGGEAEAFGEFANAPAPGDHVGNGVFFGELIYGGSTVDVDVFQAAAGDANGDREVNNTDLQAILGAGSFGNPGDWDWGQGDFNADGAVNNGDLQLILATGFFGAGPYAALAPDAGSVVTVPEPSTLVLLATVALGLLFWRRRAA